MLLNLTNHPSKNWNTTQSRAAVEQWGTIQDFPFPTVYPEWDGAEIARCADAVAEEAMALNPDAILCQGEMTLCFALVSRFQQSDIPVMAASSARDVVETVRSDGSTRKEVAFHFVRFREYPKIL